jgi:ABC-type lipoprotein export system ATPase subunit
MMILLENVNKTYHMKQGSVIALENINLLVRPGEFVMLLGPSGSGKSTLLSMIGLLSGPTGGSIRIDGRDTRDLSDRQRTDFRREKFGFVFQFPSLVNTLNVRENVLLPKLFKGRLADSDWREADRILEKVGLADKRNSRPYELSGGEQRRVALARALIHDPEVILADEPTGALDNETARRIMLIFSEINRRGKTVLIVTHDESITASGSRKIYLQKGRILDDKRTICSGTANPYN